jgi:omega-amidase
MNLKLTLIQSSLQWENKSANLQMFAEKITSITEDTDLIILPEMFSTGFSMQAEKLAEDMTGETVQWMKEKAAQKRCVITGSFICKENGSFFNRLVWMRPDGTCSTYDKRHLFSMGGEDKHYSAGTKKIIEEIKSWKICPLVCYDLRFPVWSMRTVNADYDLLIYAANWPERRSHPWKTLLLARAIENQCYVAGLNRVGNDAADIYHSGDSAVISAKGEVLTAISNGEEGIITLELNKEELLEFRRSFPVINDTDKFEIL